MGAGIVQSDSEVEVTAEHIIAPETDVQGAFSLTAPVTRESGVSRTRPSSSASSSSRPLNLAPKVHDQSYWKLFAAWDVDFVSMEVLLGGLPILAPFWEVGGGLARPPDSDFPCGLEICTNPFTVGRTFSSGIDF